MKIEFANDEGFRVPLFSYFLVVGSLLAGLLFYADTMTTSNPLPFVTQKVGLPESYKAPRSIPQQYYAARPPRDQRGIW
jgi:hypothetical protein